jgi:dihydroorotate dehydrogenase
MARMNRWLASAATAASLPLLRRLDPERAHDLGLAGLRWLQPLWPELKVGESLAVTCAGLRFSHPLGLAAGFDKNGDCIDALGALGFSHLELGTVTPRPQPGNPKPRMFRIRAADALVNRMGFNNAGVDHLAARVAASPYAGIRGISIGKNADTPLDTAESDYVACLRKVHGIADYVAVNVSSPNTARLRELQGREGLERIVGALLEERSALATRDGRRVPLFVKIAPNLDDGQIGALADTLRSLGVDGVIATNTSNDLTALGVDWPEAHRGGLSGSPIHALSVAVIRKLRAALGPGFPIIGVGGILDADAALETLDAGADLLQVWTGFALRGPRLVEKILAALLDRAERRLAAPPAAAPLPAGASRTGSR